MSLRDFDGTDSVTLNYNGTAIGPFVRGVNYTAADIQAALSGNEVQRVVLAGYDTDGDSYTLTFRGATSHPIVRGQNNTAAGIANAIQGGNEQQQVTLTNFTPATQSFTISIGGNTSTPIGLGGADGQQRQHPGRDQRHRRLPRRRDGGQRRQRRLHRDVRRRLAGIDVSALDDQHHGTATAAVRETAKGGAKLATWPDGAALTVGTVTDSGYNLLLRGAPFTGVDADPFSVTNATGATGTVPRPPRAASRSSAPARPPTSSASSPARSTTPASRSASAARWPTPTSRCSGSPSPAGRASWARRPRAARSTTRATPSRRPATSRRTSPAPGNFTIPPRTPFALTGSATDPNGDALTYMWEQVDRAGISGGSTAGTALLSNTKTNGALFRQFGVGTDIPLADSLKYHSPGLNLADANPTRVFPDMGQILANNTNAATGACPERRPPRRPSRPRSASASPSSCRRRTGSASSTTAR